MSEMIERVAKAIGNTKASIMMPFSGMAMPIGYTQEGWEAAIDEALKS